MIVGGPSRLHDLFHAIWKPLAALTAIDVVVTIAHALLGWTWLVPREVPLPLVGTGLVVFLGLRNNTAYARWWEARTLLGAVVNQSRNFARTVSMLLGGSDEEARREELIMHQIAWATALRLSLRQEESGPGSTAPCPGRRCGVWRARPTFPSPSSGRWRGPSARRRMRGGSTAYRR